MPKLKAKYSILDEEFRKKLPVLLDAPQMREFSELLEDYIDISRKRLTNKWALRNLQLHILQDLIYFENSLRKLKEGTIKPPEITEIAYSAKEEGDRLKAHITFFDIFAKSLREVVDGIIWRMFNYDRPLLYHMTDVRPNVRIATGGLMNEILQWMMEYEQTNQQAVLTCLSNFISIGDVVVKKGDNSFDIIEVKSRNKRGGRITRQKSRLFETVDIVNVGSSETQNLRFATLDVYPDNYLQEIRTLITEANDQGIGVTFLGDHCIIECIDMEKIDKLRDSGTVFSKLDDLSKPILDRWHASEDLLFPFSNIDRFNFSRNFAPYTIFPFSSNVCADLMTGRLYLTGLYNFSEIVRKFERQGWTVKNHLLELKNMNEEKLALLDVEQVKLLTIEKDDFYTDVPPGLLARIDNEFLKPEVLVKLMDEIKKYGEKEKKTELLMVSLEQEPKIWN